MRPGASLQPFLFLVLKQMVISWFPDCVFADHESSAVPALGSAKVTKKDVTLVLLEPRAYSLVRETDTNQAVMVPRRHAVTRLQ